MKVSELSGALLDLWVARAIGQKVRRVTNFADGSLHAVNTDDQLFGNGRFSPSTDWKQGGPIIEHAAIAIWREGYVSIVWNAGFDLEHADGPSISMDHWHTGITPLVAAMRAYVASKFGDEVADEEA